MNLIQTILSQIMATIIFAFGSVALTNLPKDDKASRIVAIVIMVIAAIATGVNIYYLIIW
jgi:hypothetical protein